MQYTKGIKDLLAADGMVTARVGTKIYPIEAPSGTAMPFVTYEHTSSTVYHTKEGTAYQQARIEIVVYSTTYSEAVQVGKFCKTALDGESISSSSPIKYNIDRIFFTDEEVERLENPDRYAYVLEVEAFVLF